MFCTACATANPLAADRCAVCGAGLARSVPASRLAHGPARSRRFGRLRGTIGRALAIVPVVLLLTAGGAVGARYRTERAELAAAYTRAERALAAGDFDTAISAF